MSIKLSYDVISDIAIDNSEKFTLIQEILEDVDDHGDSTKRLIFQDNETKKFYHAFISIQKEWGFDADINPKEFDCREVIPREKIVTVYETL